MYFLYDLLYLVYAVLYLPYLLLTRRAYPGFAMRFGIFPSEIQNQLKGKTHIWLHAVSVGEVMAVEVFMDQLSQKYPGHQLVLTVTTKTGYALAGERLKNKAVIIPSPLDLSWVAGSFAGLIDPKIYIAVETEIWPNLYRQLSRRNVPIVVINGRISENSFGRYKAVKFLLKGVLSQVTRWCMQAQKDAQRIIELGAESSRVEVCGNIKFDGYSSGTDPKLENFPPAGLWWVAGSTHPGEEEIVLNVYSRVLEGDGQWRLVIAPRHVERADQIVELCKRRGFKVMKLSEIGSPAGNSESRLIRPNTFGGDNCIIVVDLIGQLRSLYEKASLVFIGKTLCVGGGQNIIEPAFYGKAIVIGPRFENFRDIVACFKEQDAIVQVQDASGFEATVMALCRDLTQRDRLGQAAQAVVKANQGAARRSLECLEPLLK